MACWTPDQGRALLNSGEDSDIIIECRGKTFNVHKVIICVVTDHFKLLCNGSFKVSPSIPLDHRAVSRGAWEVGS
jgi:hypothetical protein